MRAVEIHVLKGEPPQIELIDHLKGDQNILLHGRGLLLALNLPHFSLHTSIPWHMKVASKALARMEKKAA